MNKHNSRLFLLFVSLALCGWLPLAGATAPAAEAPAWAHADSDLAPDPAVTWGTLGNGLRYAVLPWPEPPDRVSLRLVVNAGSLHEREDQRGLAHFLEHMAFNGTRHFSAGEMVEYFQRLGMDFGPDTNAHTWWRETVYKLELPRNEPGLLEDAFRLLRDYADGMLLGEGEIERERGVILSEKRDRDSPQYRSYEQQVRFSLPESLIPERLTIGTEEVIRNAPRQTFVDYYRDWYTADRIAVVAVGNISIDEARDLVQRHFADLAPAPERRPDPDLGKLTPRPLATRMFDDPALPNVGVDLYGMRPLQPQPDTAARRLQRLHRSLATEIINRRLETLAKEADAPFLSAQAWIYDWLDFVGYSGISAETLPENWEAALGVISRELRRALEHGFTAGETRAAAARLRNRLEEAARGAPTRKSREISEQISRTLIDGLVFRNPQQDLELLGPQLAEVTPAAVHAALADAWATDERYIFVAGNLHRRVDAVYLAGLEEAVEPPPEDSEAAFAYADFGAPAPVRTAFVHDDLGIEQLVLDNGVRVSLKATDFEASAIRVAVRIGAGRLDVPRAQPALAALLQSIFTEGGLAAHSADDLRRILAGHTVSTRFAIEDDAFVLGGVTNADDLLLQLRLLAAHIADPGWRPEAERLARRGYDALYNELRSNPQAILRHDAERLLAGGDPRFGIPPRASLEQVTTEQVRAWFEPILREGYLEIALVGALPERDAALQAVRATFGALPRRAETPRVLREAGHVAFPRGAEAVTLRFVSDIPQSFVTVQWPGADRSDVVLTRRLGVMANVLSDRLRKEIREAIGEAYSPYAYNTGSEVFVDFGYVRALVGTDPRQTAFIADMLVRLGAEMAANGIDADELVRAIEPMKTALREWRRNNNYWLNSVLLGSHARPEKLDWARSLEGFYDTVSTGQIDALARQYLQPEDALPLFIVPAAN
jgi:zinc protease